MEYFTSIAIGTPAQSFRALIDITSSDVFVPSIACMEKFSGVCDSRHFLYHPSWSRTRTSTGTELHMQEYGPLFYEATVSRDTFSVAGIEIPDQAFHEGTEVSTDPTAFFSHSMDAILGLGPDSSMSPAGLAGPLTNMFERGLLDRNIVSIMLARWFGDIEEEEGARSLSGELMLGGINEELLLPNTTMPFLTMSNKTDPPADGRVHGDPPPLSNGTWQVPARAVSVTWLNETSGENQTERVELADSWTARLDTMMFYVTAPEPIVELLWTLADPILVPYFYPFIFCQDRDRLPNLVYTLGAGDEATEFVLTPHDYTLEASMFGFGHMCLWTVGRGYGGYDEREVIELGSPFLRAFYVALDADNRKVGLGTPWWRPWL